MVCDTLCNDSNDTVMPHVRGRINGNSKYNLPHVSILGTAISWFGTEKGSGKSSVSILPAVVSEKFRIHKNREMALS